MATRRPRTNEQKLHAAIIAAAAVFAVAMVGAAAWALTRPLPPGAFDSSTVTSAGEASSTVTTTSPGAVPTSAASTQAAVSGGAVVPPTSNAATVTLSAAHRIAFHIGPTLYIAGEDAKTKSPMHVVGTNYALSPDGRTVAAVEKGKLVVASVGQHLLASSPATPGLTAEAVPPVWMPDSSAVLFVRASNDGEARVWRLDRGTGAAVEVGAGSGVAVSPSGRSIALIPSEDSAAPAIAILTSGSAKRTVRVPSGDPVAVALSNDRLYVSTVTTSGTSAIWSVAYDGSKKRQLVASGVAGASVTTYGELMLSPNGTKLLFAADGDDGFSRLWTVPTAGGRLTAISGRRDGYAVSWTSDGKGILFIEGNAFQGQDTALWRSDLSGNRRKKLVNGATL